jgi:hypothetical protein
MSADTGNIDVIHNRDAKRFEVQLGDQLAIADYQRAGKNIIFTHTEVPKAFEGRGIAGRMARTALDYAKEQNLKVQAVCPYMSAYIRKHPEYQPITWGYE